jgi:hypothetical protein
MVDETLELDCNVDLGATQESIALLLLVPPFSGDPRLDISWGYGVIVYISGLLRYLMAVEGNRDCLI